MFKKEGGGVSMDRGECYTINTEIMSHIPGNEEDCQYLLEQLEKLDCILDHSLVKYKSHHLITAGCPRKALK